MTWYLLNTCKTCGGDTRHSVAFSHSPAVVRLSAGK